MRLKLNYDILTKKNNKDSYIVKNILNGRLLEVSEDVINIMNYMRNSFTVEDCAREFNLKNETVRFIISEIRNFGGMIGDDLSKVTPNITHIPNSLFDSNNEIVSDKVCMLGVPYDGATTGVSGSKAAPNTIRNYTSKYSDRYIRIDGESYVSYPNIDIFKDEKVFDMGDVAIIPGESSYEVHKRIKEIYKNQTMKHSNKIIAIGGDHSITYPILDSFEEDFILVKLDAHYDDNIILNNVVNHANFISATLNIENMKNIIHIGIREPRKPGLQDNGFVISSDEYRDFGFQKLNNFITNENINFYISIDIDVLDPSIAPGTGFTIPFGLKLNDIFDIILALKKSGNIIGADIVEYNPLLDKNKSTLYVTLELLKYLVENI